MNANDDEPTTHDDTASAPAKVSATPDEAAVESAPMAKWKIAVLALLAFGGGGAIAGLGVLFFSDSNADEGVVYADKKPGKNTPFIDALVSKATQSRFELRERSGKRTTMYIRPADRPYLDILHAQSHASLGQPVRVYYRTDDGKKYATYLEDSAVLF